MYKRQMSDYRTATGFEALMGWLYLTNKSERMMLLIKEGLSIIEMCIRDRLVMYVVDKAAVDLLQLPKDEYVVVPDRTYADYVYDAEKLRTFSGKKYHKKKNHLNAFKREYEGRYEFKFLSKKDEPEILAFLEDWKKHKSDTAVSYTHLIESALKNNEQEKQEVQSYLNKKKNNKVKWDRTKWIISIILLLSLIHILVEIFI